MSIRTVQTSFTSSAFPSAMSPFPNVLASLDLNAVYPPGLGGTPRTQSAATPNWNSSPRSFHRSGNKRHPQGMRLPSSSFLSQNQHRRASFSGPPKSPKTEANSFGSPSYQRTSRFDPFGDSKETPLSPSSTAQPVYTHYYYYDPQTNRPTLAYADEKNSVNAANLTASTNLLLDALLNGARRDIPSPSPPKASPISARPQNRSPSPPQSSRPRAAAISHPNPSSSISAKPPISLPESAPTPAVVSAPPPAQPKMPKAQRDAIARVVANMLLNRADTVNRRGRRCSQPYVKSGLSRVVFVE